MLYTEFEAGEKTYKLALSTKAVCQLEKKIGCNPLSIFGTDGATVPTVSVMVLILHASLQKYEHNITEENTFDIFDKWLEAGNTITDFIKVILDIYNVSGLIHIEDEGKN